MFKSREDIIAALLALDIDPYDRSAEPPKPGILSRIFGGGDDDELPPPVQFRRSIAEGLAAMAKPSARLHSAAARGKQALGASRIGGAPDLPPGVEWPTRPAMPDLAKSHGEPSGINYDDVDLSFLDDIKDENGKSVGDYLTPEMREKMNEAANTTNQPLATYYAAPGPLPFLAQINFAQMTADGGLDGQPDMPTTGVLYVFYDLTEQVWGFDPKDHWAFKFIWFDGDTDTLERRETPAILSILNEQEYLCTVPTARKLSAHAGFSFPETVDEDIHTLPKMTEDEQDGAAEWICDYHDALSPDHRIGGWPSIVQNPMETECALVAAGKFCGDGDAFSDPANADIIATAPEWTLLLQIDSDGKAGFMFGDCGKLYVWIRKADLAARAFDKAWIVVQCY